MRNSKFAKIAVACCLAASLAACATTTKQVDTTADKKARVAEIDIQLGMAYLENQSVSQAKEKFLLALQADPALPEAWYSMAYFYEATGDDAQADNYYLKAIALAPQRGDSQNNYGTYLCHRGQYRQSIQHFQLATEDLTYLDAASAYENAGLCSLKIPDKKMAAHYFKMAIMQDPNRNVSRAELAKLTGKSVLPMMQDNVD